ncbi:zinc finger, HIT-type containing 1 [Helicostylum pulchrum]|uniref:HIT-type domain-containing protein n=1 Tax=Mucor flavus TaxID=439312 RepID=A0ABP9Z6X0_9FUNG|nr:zinc finger, HIT-type containing 1 [Helicostylum pulchrum]
MSKRAKVTHADPEVHARHLKRQLESLEKDNHQSLNDIEGLISIALSAQEDDGLRKSRGQRGHNIYSTKTNLNSLLEESPVTAHCYQTCQVTPSTYPARRFCSVCGFTSDYKCLKCGMKYCSTKCLSTHTETRCLKWTA